MQAGFAVHAGCQSGSVEVMLELMANGSDSHSVATHFKRGNETRASRASEGNDDFALPVVQGASGLPAAIGERFAFVEHRLGVAAQRGLDPHGGEGGSLHAPSVMQM